ncbi:vacuolar protein sorting-associated protein 54, chloroplastic isoform X1 [Apium graveolens]|uniref:vacuolar protein sorting-associated protein 54, chloroplastic isoform X1 n=1 Tax=Apium graveolens TaxID=4045 RepID=UPI003D7A5D1F
MDSQPSQSSGRFSVDQIKNSPRNSSSSFSQRLSSSNSLSKTLSDTQSLSAILNNPQSNSDATWTSWWSPSSVEFASINVSKAGSEISKSQFEAYLLSVFEQFNRFNDIQSHRIRESSVEFDQLGGGQGEALVACLREVPALYFKEDFELEDGGTFRAACPFSTANENLVLQEKLSQYLDVVELHLVKEISLRSNSFFEAQEQLEGLNVRIVEGCSRIRELKETIRILESDLVDSARQIQERNSTRSNLLVLQQKLRLILNVNHALSALKLLVASADCAGALDITDDLQQLLDGDELTGLHCFRHLGDHVNGAIDSINSILSAEFMRTSIQDTGDTDAIILVQSKAKATSLTNGIDDDVKIDEEETSNIRDQLLPLIIGLLRTAKLPTVLRLYRDTLTVEMKSAIKMVVSELLPVLVSRPSDSDFTQGERVVDSDSGGSSLVSKLKTLSSDNFVQLLRTIFRVVWAHLVQAAEVKKAIEWIMCNLDGHYAADSVAAAIAVGAVNAEASQETNAQVSSFLPYPLQRRGAVPPSYQGRVNDATSPSNVSRNFRADVLRENTEAVFAACDAAHGRWAKLLGVRAVLHPKLRLQEFLSMHNISQEFITATEKIGGRLGYSIRGALQSQAKAFVDFQHESRMAKIRAVLDQETWAEVDVADDFQAITNSLYFEESVDGDDLDDASHSIARSENETVSSNISLIADGQVTNSVQPIHRTNSTEVSPDITAPVNASSSTRPVDSTLSAPTNSASKKDRTLTFRGVGYHMVNCGLVLLKMLSEYIDMNDSLPALSAEIVQRVVELLKFFNTKTCQLVLGAGAMQVSGLKSITSKHLALASQVISFTYAIIPEIRKILFSKVPETRQPLLMAEIDRVAQDYKVHRDEIHTKLVQIMRERLLFHLRSLPQIVESWNRTEDTDSQPSIFARSITKAIGYLQRVLSRNLHEADVQAIFRQVVVIFHTHISDACSLLEISTPQAKNRLYCDLQHILGCIRSLPSDDLNNSEIPNRGKLDDFIVQKFGGGDS